MDPDQSPEAEHEVASEEDQLKVDEPPEVTEVGEAFRLTVGATTAAFTLTEQVSDSPPLVTVTVLLP